MWQAICLSWNAAFSKTLLFKFHLLCSFGCVVHIVMGFGWFYVHMYYILKSLYRFCFEDLFKLFVISPVSEYAYFPTTYISLLIIPCMIVYVTNKQEPYILCQTQYKWDPDDQLWWFLVPHDLFHIINKAPLMGFASVVSTTMWQQTKTLSLGEWKYVKSI